MDNTAKKQKPAQSLLQEAGEYISNLIEPQEPLLIGRTDEHFRREGMTRQPQVWEDGRRGTSQPGHWEWWYSDAHLSDGSTLVIIFFDKNAESPQTGLAPEVWIELTRPDGTKYHQHRPFKPEQFSALKGSCDVQIGPNYIRGDLKSYQIVVETEDGLGANLQLVNKAATYRPGNGHFYAGKNQEDFYTWFCAVPNAELTGTVTVAGRQETVTGRGYHDHQWGNSSLHTLWRHWFWARVTFDDYTLLIFDFKSMKKYGSQHLPVFFLQKGDQVLADDHQFMQVEYQDLYRDEHTQFVLPRRIVYTYDDKSTRFMFTLQHREDIYSDVFEGKMDAATQALAETVGLTAGYKRFRGEATFEVSRAGQTQSFESEVVYEFQHGIVFGPDEFDAYDDKPPV